MRRVRDGGSVVLAGPAGVGKSRLAAEVAAVVGADGTSTRRVAGTPAGAAIPYSAVSGLLGAAAPADAVGAVAEALEVDGDGPGPVVVVDDVHHLDDASATVLHQLLTAGRVRLVATHRVGEPLSAARLALVGDAAVERVVVEPLTDGDVDALLGAALGGPLDGSTSKALSAASAGNVLFLRELVEGSVAGGTLEQRAGLWRLTGPLAATSLLDDLVAARIAPLDGPRREAVEVLALAEPVAVDLLREVVALEVLEELERDGLALVRADGNRLAASLVHPLYGELVRARMPAITRLRLSRLLADAVDALDVELGVADELRAAVWRLDGGQPGDADRLLRAARLAFAAGDTLLCSRLASSAFDVGADAEAALLASWCFDEMGDPATGGAILDRAVVDTADERAYAYLQLRRAEQRWWHDHDPASALAILDGLEVVGDLARRFAVAQRSVFAALSGRPFEAAPAEALLGDDDPWVDTNSALAHALSLLLGGRPEEGAEVAAAAYERAVGAPAGALNGDPGVHVATRTFNLVAAGALGEAGELAELVHLVAAGQAGRQAKAWGAMLLAEVAFTRGQPIEAQRWFTEAEVLWADGGLPGQARWCATGAALALAQQGRGAELDATLARAAGYDPAGFEMFEFRYELAQAWAAQLAGASSVPDLVRAVVVDGVALGDEQFAIEALHDLARFGRKDEAGALAEIVHVSGPLNETRLAFVAQLSAGDAAGLEEVADRFEAIGALLFAAEAAAEAARAHRRKGRTAAADRAAGRSGALAARCPGAATPPLAERTATTVASARELQVARLASTGMSNRAIAEHLVVSERTVENHLYRVFTKLGVSSRDELAAALPPE